MTIARNPPRARRVAFAMAWRLAGSFTRSRHRVAFMDWALLAVPVAVAVVTHFREIEDWRYNYGDMEETVAMLAQREAALGLAEAAARIQAGGPLAHRWTEGADGPLGFVESSDGFLPLATRRFGNGPHGALSVGVVRGGTDAVVIHVGNLTSGRCRLLGERLGAYPRSMASAAYLVGAPRPEGLPDVLSQVEWKPIGEVLTQCAATGDRRGTLLLRMDGRLGRARPG